MPLRLRACTIGAALITSLLSFSSFGDALNGKALYNQVPDEAEVLRGNIPRGCRTCHDDPIQNNNQILTRGRDPALINNALNSVAEMAFLRPLLSASQIDDISAYLRDLNVQGVALALDTLRLQFGVQPVGVATLPRRVTLTNFGTDPLSITSIAVAGGQAADFTVAGTSTCSTANMVAANGSCFFDIVFTPGDAGTRAAALTVASNSSVSPHNVSLTGGQAVAQPAGATNVGGGGCTLQRGSRIDPSLVLLLVTALIHAMRSRRARSAVHARGAIVASVAAAGFILAALGVHAAQLGNAAPDFELPDFHQNKVKLSQLRGKVVYVDFWASWCGPCRKSFPWMNAMQDKYGKDGLQVIAINMDQERADAEAFLAQLPASFKVVWDPRGDTARTFNVKGMPSSFVIDREGKLHKSHTGFRVSQQDALERAIKQLLAAR